ncbi:MAG: Hsp33 family molecular chaperone HslO [Symbiobacteriaceae bacterium]|nr:Hsp33 family molecular chaperone HslO [Symbiobacteriaceae bacterium]
MNEMIIATAAQGSIRLLALDSTALVREAAERHGTAPVASAALGRTLSMAALMSASLNEEQRLTLRILGDGPLGAIVVDTDHLGNVRGYVQEPWVHLPPNSQGKLDVSRAVGKGMLHVTKDLGLKEPYQGQVPLLSGEIAEDFARYFLESEQLPSAIALGVLVGTRSEVLAAGGYMVQMLPVAEEEVEELIRTIEERIREQPMITQLLTMGLTPQAILERIAGDWGLEILEYRQVRLQCKCSRERLAWTLMSLGELELLRMIKEQGGAEITCNFCRQVYHFNQAELRELMARIRLEREQ